LRRDVGFLFRELAAPHFFPEDVRAFREEEVGRYQRVVKQQFGTVAVGLGNGPFDANAGVDNEALAG
jgi:hypothetical protein